MQMERMVTNTPSSNAIGGFFNTVGLAFDAGLHQVVSANGTGINDNIPGPESNRGPFFHLEAFFLFGLHIFLDLRRLVICDHGIIDVHGVELLSNVVVVRRMVMGRGAGIMKEEKME